MASDNFSWLLAFLNPIKNVSLFCVVERKLLLIDFISRFIHMAIESWLFEISFDLKCCDISIAKWHIPGLCCHIWAASIEKYLLHIWLRLVCIDIQRPKQIRTFEVCVIITIITILSIERKKWKYKFRCVFFSSSSSSYSSSSSSNK